MGGWLKVNGAINSGKLEGSISLPLVIIVKVPKEVSACRYTAAEIEIDDEALLRNAAQLVRLRHHPPTSRGQTFMTSSMFLLAGDRREPRLTALVMPL